MMPATSDSLRNPLVRQERVRSDSLLTEVPMRQRPLGPSDSPVDTATATLHRLSVQELTSEAFAAYGEIVRPVRTGGQAAPAGGHSRSQDAKLGRSGGQPRLWIMQLPHVGLRFSRIARHLGGARCPASGEGT